MRRRLARSVVPRGQRQRLGHDPRGGRARHDRGALGQGHRPGRHGEAKPRHANANGSIGQIFDKDKVREQLEFQQAFGQLGMQIAGDVLKDLKKDDPDLWGEGKAGAIALHAAVAGIGAALGGGNVAGAIAGTVAGDLATNLVRDQVELAVAGLSGEMRDQVTKVILNVVASAAGGAVGGVSGAGGASVADRYNRQLHPSETEWIEKNAKDYAARKGISEEEAVRQLAAQAYRKVQTGAEGEWDASADAFLKEAHGMLPEGGYMFYAPPYQRNDSGMYAVSLPEIADFYVRNGLQLPAESKVADAATKNAQVLSLMSNLTLGAGGMAAAVALGGLPPTLLSWALANPADAVTIGVISAETAAAIQTGAIAPNSVLGGISNVPGKLLSAGGTGSATDDLIVQFGRVENQVSHAFRHIDAAGFEREMVSRAIRADLSIMGAEMKSGQYAGSVVVDGTKLELRCI